MSTGHSVVISQTPTGPLRLIKHRGDSKGSQKLRSCLLELEGRVKSRHGNSSLETEDNEGQNARPSTEWDAGALGQEGAGQQVPREDARCMGDAESPTGGQPIVFVRLHGHAGLNLLRPSSEHRLPHRWWAVITPDLAGCLSPSWMGLKLRPFSFPRTVAAHSPGWPWGQRPSLLPSRGTNRQHFHMSPQDSPWHKGAPALTVILSSETHPAPAFLALISWLPAPASRDQLPAHTRTQVLTSGSAFRGQTRTDGFTNVKLAGEHWAFWPRHRHSWVIGMSTCRRLWSKPVGYAKCQKFSI